MEVQGCWPDPEVLGEIRNFCLLIQALCCSLSAEMQKAVQDLSEFRMVFLLFCKWKQVPFVPFVFLLYQDSQELREDFNLKERCKAQCKWEPE